VFDFADVISLVSVRLQENHSIWIWAANRDFAESWIFREPNSVMLETRFNIQILQNIFGNKCNCSRDEKCVLKIQNCSWPNDLILELVSEDFSSEYFKKFY